MDNPIFVLSPPPMNNKPSTFALTRKLLGGGLMGKTSIFALESTSLLRGGNYGSAYKPVWVSGERNENTRRHY